MKGLVKISAIVLLLLLGLYLVFRYLLFAPIDAPHLRSYVPKERDFVLIVDAERMLDMAIRDALFHPSIGKEEKEDKEDDDQERISVQDVLSKGLWHGLDLPKELLIYGQGGSLDLLLPLSDAEDFDAMMSELAQGPGLFDLAPDHYTDSALHLLVMEDHLRLHWDRTWTAEWAPRQEELADLEMQRQTSSLATGSIAGNALQGQLQLQSKPGGIDIYFTSEGPLPFQGRLADNEAPAQLNIQLGPGAEQLSALLMGSSWLSEATHRAGLDPMALEPIWDGSLDLAFFGWTTVEDTALSYRYNDDFEKVEVQEIIAHLEGDFSLTLGLRKPSDSLFYQRGWVKTLDGDDIFVSFPLQEVFYEEDDTAMIFRSKDRNHLPSPAEIPVQGHLLSVNMMRMQHDISPAHDSLLRLDAQPIRHLFLDQEDSTRLHLEIMFKDEHRAGLFSLLRGW